MSEIQLLFMGFKFVGTKSLVFSNVLKNYEGLVCEYPFYWLIGYEGN